MTLLLLLTKVFKTRGGTGAGIPMVFCDLRVESWSCCRLCVACGCTQKRPRILQLHSHYPYITNTVPFLLIIDRAVSESIYLIANFENSCAACHD